MSERSLQSLDPPEHHDGDPGRTGEAGIAAQLKNAIERRWYGRPGWLLLLVPLAGLFTLIAAARRHILTRRARHAGVPVVVIGNISVGGTGKTPVLITLVEILQSAGFSPGVVSRGYGASIRQSVLVKDGVTAADVGDEPLLIRRTTGCPVAVGPDRCASVELLRRQGCSIVLSDDGLQHYRLARQGEIIIIDGRRGMGNGWRLPVGPLRESPRRLRQVEWVLVNGLPECRLPTADIGVMHIQPVAWRNLRTGVTLPLEEADFSEAAAVAGIGHPERFFRTLRALGLRPDCRAFDDHHPFRAEDFAFASGRPVLMTEKDAVKCEAFAQQDWWALQVRAQLPEPFVQEFLQFARTLSL